MRCVLGVYGGFGGVVTGSGELVWMAGICLRGDYYGSLLRRGSGCVVRPGRGGIAEGAAHEDGEDGRTGLFWAGVVSG